MKHSIRAVVLAAAAVAASGIILVATGVASASNHTHAGFNGMPGSGTTQAKSTPCSFANDSGATVTSISIDTLTGSDTVYWERYASHGVTSTKVIFTLTGPAASPLHKQSQEFVLGSGSTTSIETPFGIPFWGGSLTSGTYHLKITTFNGTVRGPVETCAVSAS